MTSPIGNIGSIGNIDPVRIADFTDSASGSFQSALASAISNIQTLQDTAGQAAQKFMTGENEDVHTVALTGQKAELAFELGLQVRNKVISAYQEVMKMQL